MIKLITIKAHNIGLYDELVVNFDSRGVVLLTGKNGSGKSTVVDIVQLGLFGRTARYDSYKDLLKKGTNEGHIAISFQVGDQVYAINRTIMPQQQKLKLHRGEEDLTGIHLEATQDKIDNALKTHWSIFSNIVTVSGEPVIFSETDGYQKSFMERMLGFEQYSEARELSKSYKAEVQALHAKSKVELESNMLKQQSIKMQMKLLNEKDEDVKKAKLADCKTQLEGLTQNITATNEFITKSEAALEEFNKGVAAFKKNHEDLMVEFEKVSKAREEYAGKLLDIEKNISQLKAMEASTECSLCGSRTNPVILERISRDLAKLEEDEKSTEQYVESNINNYYTYYRDQAAGASDAVSEYRAKAQAEAINLQSLRLGKAKIVSGIDNINKRIAEIEAQSGPETTTLTNDLATLEKEVIQISVELLQHQINLDRLEACIEMFGDKGIKSLKIEQYLVEISEKMNTNLEFLTNGQMSCYLVPTKKLKTSTQFRDKMTLKVTDRETGDHLLDYKHCSKGQRACVNVSALLAFHEIIRVQKGVAWEVLFLDEVLESLDTDYMQNMVRLLAVQAGTFPTIVVTTHRPELAEVFDNVWTVKKKGGASTLEDSST